MQHAFIQRTILASVLGIASALNACGPKNADVSTVKHDMNRPTRGTDAWMWQGLTSSQYGDNVAPIVGIDPSALLADDHALVKKTQFWLDKIDAELRAKHGDQLVNAPKPIAKVVRESSPNAFVAPVGVCYAVKVKKSGATGDLADKAYLDLKSGELASFPNDIPCVDASDVAEVKKMADRFNAGARGDCRLTYSESTKTLSLSSACAVNDDMSGAPGAKQLVILETANFVTVHTGLFPIMSEEAFVGVLAHELGHYYRSHMTANEKDYDFFYTLDRNQPSRRPTADESKRELGEGAIASATLLSSSDVQFNYPSQKLRSELFFAAGSLINAACAAGSCSAACTTAKTFIDSQTFRQKISTFPYGQNSTAQGAAVSDFEGKALACLETIKLSAQANTQTATAASWDVVTKSVSTPTWPSWLSTLPASTQRALGGIMQLNSLRLGQNAPTGTELKAVMLNASKLLVQQDKTAEDTLKLAQSTKLGQYTGEQEADEESAEWISALGIDAKSSVEAMHSLGEGAETSMHGFVLGQQDCDRLWNNGWLDQNGDYYFVPVGDYSEVHHSVCYRMFNLEREIAAHNHVPAQVELPNMGGAQWKQLQDTAGDLGLAPPSTGGTFSGMGESRVAKFARKSPMTSCVYSSSYW